MNPRGYATTRLRHCLGGMLLAGTCLSAAAVVKVTVIAQETIPPKWIEDGGRARGICPDILAALQRLEPRLDFVVYGKGRSLPAIEAALGSGAATAGCALMATTQRHQVARIVGVPLYTIRHRLAGRVSDPTEVQSLADLVRMHALVNTARGSAFSGRLKAAGVQVDDSTGNNVVNLRKMLGGHGRYTYMNELTLQHYIRAQKWQQQVRIQPLLMEEAAYFWVSRKAGAEVTRLLEPALDRLAGSGELARIYARWSRPD